MSEKFMKTIDANEAVARIAHSVTDTIAIYPITPSTPMGEFSDLWSSEGKKNIWGTVPVVVEMQSEGGASGAFHGALQAGGLSTTFTASQGLLLMIPNMYKIAGELTPAVMHVSARSLACQALSIFGDHSDVMATRSTGFAMLCSGSVQEAQDMAMISHSATLEARIPFIHFFEGFRVSHEVNKFEALTEAQMREMIEEEFVEAHRMRALTPDHPVIRGTAQNPDVYFQARETVNPFYELTPGIVEKYMDKFAKLTGRKYNLVDYYGHKEADRVVVIMGSGSKPVLNAVNALIEQGEKVGVLQIRLYRPFPVKQFLEALPETVKSIAVLDRTKEPGAVGEPLYQDVVTVLSEALMHGKIKTLPRMIGGRYGLSSKEFTPAMAKGVLDELKKSNPKQMFTIGIEDDVSRLSLEYDPEFITASKGLVQAMFYGLGSDGTVGANKNTIKIIGGSTDLYAQGYFVYDSKKSGSRTVSHLRFGPNAIDMPYLIQSADFIGVHQFNFFEKTDVLGKAAQGAVVLVNSTYGSDEIWSHLPGPVQKIMLDKKVKLYVIDAYKVAKETGMGFRINTIMQTCFFKLAGVLPVDEAIAKIKEAIYKTYSKKGDSIVNMNYNAVDQALANLHEVKLPDTVSADALEMPEIVSANAPEFVQKVTAPIMADHGDDLPVSALPIDGTYPCGTTKWEKRNVSLDVADWDPSVCIQCGKCSVVCPHGVIRSKRYDAALAEKGPEGFKHVDAKGKGAEGKQFTLQVYVEDCTGCGLCHEVCPAKNNAVEGKKAINITPKAPRIEQECASIDYFETLPENDRTELNLTAERDIQCVTPYFEFSGACAGCGETSYVKMVSQMFGDRMLVANATGCSSIYGGNLPTTPWTCDKEGRGPAWSNSLFEDNAEFGLGFRVAEDKHREEAVELVDALRGQIGAQLADALIKGVNDKSEQGILDQRKRVADLKAKLKGHQEPEVRRLNLLADYLVKHSVWIMGGDGWAYDIGYGGLDHVIATDRDVNILVMDTEVYSNTGGQASKATPLGAVAKFAAGGKRLPKKNLAAMAMSYGYVYVAQISIGANPMHALKAIKEANDYNGPSLIIAYSHCIAHGINMQCGLGFQKKAVDSGFWPLFRYNPDKKLAGENPFSLDSKAPSIPVKDFIAKQARFQSLFKASPDVAEKLLEEEQKKVEEDFKKLQELAGEK